MTKAASTARAFIEAQDRLRGGPADDLCTEDYVARLASFPPMDLEGHKGFTQSFYAGFPDLRHTIERVIADGTCAALQLRITGTNTAPFMGMAATGRAISLDAIAVMDVVDGRVRALHGQFDQMGLMQQLGATGGR